MWNWPNRLAVAVNIALGILFLYFVAKQPLAPETAQWSYYDLVAILLTAIGVILAALGIGIAIMAVWGYQKITDHAVQQALEGTEKKVSDRLEECLQSDEIKERIAKLVEEKVRIASDEVYSDLAPTYPDPEGEDKK